MRQGISPRNGRTFAGRIPKLAPSGSRDRVWGIFGRKHGAAANVSWGCVGHVLVAPCVLQASDVLDGGVEVLLERHVPIRTITRYTSPTEEASRELSGHIAVVGCKGYVRFVATKRRFKRVTKMKYEREEAPALGYRSQLCSHQCWWECSSTRARGPKWDGHDGICEAAVCVFLLQ